MNISVLKSNIKIIGHFFYKYSVMQSDGNSFCGDVFMENVTMAYTDEDSIVDQIYEM